MIHNEEKFWLSVKYTYISRFYHSYWEKNKYTYTKKLSIDDTLLLVSELKSEMVSFCSLLISLHSNRDLSLFFDKVLF